MQSASITLFDKEECPFCWKVRLALATNGLVFKQITIDTDNKPADFLALSPTGKVPLLLLGEERITESSEIIAALEARTSEPVLMGRTIEQRELIADINRYSDTIIGPAIREAIFTQRGRPASEWDLSAIAQSKQQWRSCLEWLDDRFNPADPTSPVFAATFSLAECALLPRFGLAQAYGLLQSEEFPRLQQWFNHHRQQYYYLTTAPAIARASVQPE